MSLILEALRKSEAERRLGSSPELLSAMPVMRASAPRRRWPLPVAIIVVVLLVVAAMYGWSQRNAAQTSTPPAPVTASTPRPLPAAPAVSIPARTISASAPTPTPHPKPPPAPVAATPPPALAPASVPVAPSPAPVAQAANNNTTNAEPALLSLADLSPDERNGLPALKVAMHVYADDPAKRFMIVDGQRVGEGARLADGVVLVRIRRDGAEIDVRGRRVLLPKP